MYGDNLAVFIESRYHIRSRLVMCADIALSLKYQGQQLFHEEPIIYACDQDESKSNVLLSMRANSQGTRLHRNGCMR